MSQIALFYIIARDIVHCHRLSIYQKSYILRKCVYLGMYYYYYKGMTKEAKRLCKGKDDDGYEDYV